MISALETDSRVANWRQDKGVLIARDDLQKNGEALAEVVRRLTVCRNVHLEGEPQLDRLRADQLLNGQATSKQYETLAHAIADAQTQIVRLERDERLLIQNKERLARVLKEATGLAKNVARKRLYSACLEKREQLKSLVLQAKAVNEALLALEAEIKAFELGEGGSKEFILFARYPVSWNALSQSPIKSNVVTHSDTWLTHTDQVFGE